MRHVRKFPSRVLPAGTSRVRGRRWWSGAAVVAFGSLWLASAAGAFPPEEPGESLQVPSSTSLVCESQVKPGQTSTCTATVVGGGGASFPRGVVSFGGNGLGSFGNGGTCTLSRVTGDISRCRITYTPIGFGSHSIKAFYAGQIGTASTPGLEPSEASTTIQVRAPTHTSVECGPIGLPVESIACTARVVDLSADVSTPSGSVRFGNGSVDLGGCALKTESPKTATCVVNLVRAGLGSFQVIAVYSGDGGHDPSTGTTALQVSDGATRPTVAGGASQQSSSLLASPRRTAPKAKRHKKAKAAKHRASRSR